MTWQPLPAEGLYDPTFEHDACGVAFVADLAGRRSHDVVANAPRDHVRDQGNAHAGGDKTQDGGIVVVLEGDARLKPRLMAGAQEQA